MGIRCLTTFVTEKFTRWKKGPVRGELIIDGHSLSHKFNEVAHADMYGGNYMSLAKEIENFLVTLMKYEIKPFLVFDGTTDDKKKVTLVSRTHERLETAVAVAAKTSSSGNHDGAPSRTPSFGEHIVKPILASYIVIDTIKRVLGGDCLFVADGDADIDITSLAIHHRCPVLSNDSDFYIFPLQYGYIPYSKFHWSDPQSDGIYAELYFHECFCEQFGICDPSLLAVIPAIVGNDMISELDAEHRKMILQPDPDCKSLIESVVMYAASFTTLEACINTLQRQELIDPTAVLENIQEAYNNYFFVPCNICKPLDVLRTTLKCVDGSPLPEFVLKKFRVGVFSTFLIKILRKQEMYKITVEDTSESWCRLIGVPIRRAIYGILCGSDAFITELQRGENPLKYDQIQIKSVRTVTYDGRKIPLPSLESCGVGIEKNYGKEILFGILDTKEEDFKEIPVYYHLLLATTCYWYKHCTISKKDVILKAFLLNLQQPLLALTTVAGKDEKLQGEKDSMIVSSAKPPFPVPSFIHAFAQWQSLYSDIFNLSQLLQGPLVLPPVSDFLECSYLYNLVEMIIEKGVEKVIQQNDFDQNRYQCFVSAICPAEEPMH